MTVSSTKKTTAKKAVASKNTDLKIYIGPSIPKTGLDQNTILNNGVPIDALKHVDNCKVIEKLIIPIENLATARAALASVGTPEYVFAEQVSDYLKGVNK